MRGRIALPRTRDVLSARQEHGGFSLKNESGRPRFEHRGYELILRYRRFYRTGDVIIYDRRLDDGHDAYYATGYGRWKRAPSAEMLAEA